MEDLLAPDDSVLVVTLFVILRSTTTRDANSDTARRLSATVVNGRGIAPSMQVMRHSSHSRHVFAGNRRWAVVAEIRVCMPRRRGFSLKRVCYLEHSIP